MSLQQKIEEKLNEALSPTHLEVINESQLHAGHMGDDGSGESHFRIILTSDNFKESTRVGQQREIYTILAEEMKKIHALAIQITTT